MSQSSKDYRKTNELLNDLQDARVAGRSLIEFLSYNGVSMWQFLPAYVWPFFFRAVELIDVVLQLVEDVKPKEIRVFPVSDYTDPIWQGVVQSIGDRNGIRVTQLGHPLSKQYFRMQVRGILREIGVGRALRWLGRLHLNLRVFLFFETRAAPYDPPSFQEIAVSHIGQTTLGSSSRRSLPKTR